MILLFILSWCSLVLQAEPLEANRLGELNAEYSKGGRSGSYGMFVSELETRLKETEDLKEAARLATLIRAYIHGQIIAFDGAKPFTRDDYRAVLGAHATVTAFLTLSPLGTDRYREDTLRYVMGDVKGRYAQDLTIVADAVQAALWAGAAGTREHITKEVFLRWMTPAYQRGGRVDVSQALGDWNDKNYQIAQDLIKDSLDFVFGEDFFRNSDHFAHCYLDIDLAVEQKQREALPFKDGQIINVPGNGNQCGFYATGKPILRHQDGSDGPRKKFTDAFKRALYDPQLFWMLTVFAKNEDWKKLGHTDLEDLKNHDILNYEEVIQKNKEIRSFLKKQLNIRQKLLLKEIEIISNKYKNHTKNIIEDMPKLNDLNSNESLEQTNTKLEAVIDKMRNSLKDKLGKEKYYDEICSNLNIQINNVQEYKDAIQIQGEFDPLRSKIFAQHVTCNEALFAMIPLDVKERVIKAATILADQILRAGHEQLEVNPGTDVDALDAWNTSLDTLVAYLNDRAVHVLCTDAVNHQKMQLSESKKIGGYYIGKVVSYDGFSPVYTINYGGESGGHYQLYVTNNTPYAAIANVLRNPNRSNESWNLLDSAIYHSQNNAPNGQMLRDWTQQYVWR